MPSKVRKQIYLEPGQVKRLKQLSRDTGLPEAELIRQALDQQGPRVTSRQYDRTMWERERAFIEHLIQQGPVSGGRTWRREDLHER